MVKYTQKNSDTYERLWLEIVQALFLVILKIFKEIKFEKSYDA